MRFEHCLGYELFWWRETPDLHTLLSIYWFEYATEDVVFLEFVLYDEQHQEQAHWTVPVQDGQSVFVDSKTCPYTTDLKRPVTNGVLAVYVRTAAPATPRFDRIYNRLYALVDWYSDQKELVCLHSDQCMRYPSVERTLTYTEIIVKETEADRNSLVFLNGEELRPPGSLILSIQNHRGETREAVYNRELEPFSVNQVWLVDWFPDLIDFCEGEFATVSGTYNVHGVFSRPYVVTENQYFAAYHAGDLYQWSALPQALYQAFGHGEVNPMMVLRRPDLETTVNLLNTHGDLEEDFWVDAQIYDEAGQLVVERKQWLLAKRNELSRGDISPLLPEGVENFTGHVALRFSSEDRPLFPRRLQALLEYRSPHSASRAMAWSDEWNSDRRQAQVKRDPVLLQSYFRVWHDEAIESFLAITNCGIPLVYDYTARYALILRKENGDCLRYEGSVEPQATEFATLEHFFPDIDTFMGEDRYAMAIVESVDDLAMVWAGRHRRSGVYSVEHFMGAYVYHKGRYHSTAGS